MVKITPTQKPFDEQSFLKLSAELELPKLPEDYLKFLKDYNGGTPESNLIQLNDQEIKRISIQSFFGIGLVSYKDFSWHLNILKNRIPLNCLPIAMVEGGDIICITLDIENYGRIYLWLHELEVLLENEMTNDKLIPVAHSFNHLLNLLTPYNPEEEDLSGYEVVDVWIDPDFFKGVKEE